jgi:predicted TIM-barrel fold metal-dependent hydrolase
VIADSSINDAHCHFFSPHFFEALARQRGRTPPQPLDELYRELQWDDPGAPDTLADRWVAELDKYDVARAMLMSSTPGDEASIAEAAAHHPTRIVGFFMVDPSERDAPDRVRRAITELGLRGVCLFPAMHHVSLDDDRVTRLVQVAASQPGTAVFVQCGALSVGVRTKLGLPSRFDQRLGNPLDVTRLALAFPTVPFIVPHFGAGMFREVLMAADTCTNIYLDTSSSNRWIRYTPGLTLKGVFKAALSVAGSSRLLFGTDSSSFPRGWQRSVYETQKKVVLSAGASMADLALIFGGNFDRLFPL